MFGVVGRINAVKRRSRALLALNLELAKLEGKQKATAIGIAGASVLLRQCWSSTRSGLSSRRSQRG